MPFVFAILGILFLVVAVRGTQGAAFTLLQSEFVGKNSFVPWCAAIFILGAIGYAKPVKPAADAMIGLVILSMILTNKGGFFAALNTGLRSPVSPAVTPAATSFTPAGSALAAGSSLQPATANADAASLATGRALGETPAPAAPAAASGFSSFWQQLFGSAPAY